MRKKWISPRNSRAATCTSATWLGPGLAERLPFAEASLASPRRWHIILWTYNFIITVPTANMHVHQSSWTRLDLDMTIITKRLFDKCFVYCEWVIYDYVIKWKCIECIFVVPSLPFMTQNVFCLYYNILNHNFALRNDNGH